jgi:hypothetical protein
MGNEMSPDRQERHEALEGFEAKLTNGHRGDIKVMSDHLVELSRSFRVILRTDFVKPSELATFCEAKHRGMKPRFGWPAAFSVATVVCTVAGLIFKFAG